jgi:hypothetical protein
LDFTLSKYKEILYTLKNENYEFYTIEDWLSKNIQRGVVIRHDVDRRAKNSLKKAKLENALSIKSTYYFRMKRCSFKVNVIEEIQNLGHEIGYHYEELSAANNNIDKALINFEKNLLNFRKVCNVKTIAMHGKPTSKYDNRKLFTNTDLENFNLLGDAYLSINYSDKYYFSDTGRSWASQSKTNFRDYVNSIPAENIHCSNDLIGFIKTKKPNIVFLMTHPERWNDNIYNYIMYYLRDLIMKSGKIVFGFLRN